MEISVKDFFFLILRKIPVLILGAIIGFGAFFGYASVTEVDKYTCEVTMIVNAAPDTIATSGTIKASQDLTKAYIAIMKDFSFSQKINDALPENNKLPVNGIRKSMSMEAVDESQILAVSVTTTSAQNSYNIAKVIEEMAPKTLRQYFDDTGTIVVLRSAQKPTAPNPSSIKVKAALGAIVGMVVAACILLLISKLDKRIRGEEDILAVCKYPVLGKIGRVE